MSLKRVESTNINVAGTPVTVYIQPLTPGRLARLGMTEMPSLFAAGEGDSDAARALQFLFAVILAGVVAVEDSSGTRYKLRAEPDPKDPTVLTPDDLEEPGLQPGVEAYANLQVIFRRIMELSGMGDLFRAPGEKTGTSQDSPDSGPGLAHTGQNLRDGPVGNME